MAAKRRRGAPTPAAFALPGDQTDLMLGAYYGQLNAHAPFRSALASLRKALALRPPASTKSKRRRDDEEDEPEHPWRSQDAWVSKRARTRLVAFTREWHLPLESVRDLLHALTLTPVDTEPEIHAYFRTQHGSAPHAFIQADAPETFVYDPVGPSPAGARRKARAAGDAVYKQMLEQIEQAEKTWKAQGWKPVPPRSRSKSDREEGARRLFQRAVLGWRWKAIADDAAKRERAYDEATVAEHVRRWAQDLGIELPE